MTTTSFPIIRATVDFYSGGMICGSYEAEIRTYQKLEDKSGRVWLVANQEDAASNVYVHNPKDHNSQGFAGRTLTFQLEDGSSYSAKGPWHTNADALFAATGLDIRDRHRTQVAVGHRYGKGMLTLADVIYLEEAPVLGTFDRYKAVAQSFADQLDTPVYYLMRSFGGASGGPIKPTAWTEKQYQQHWRNKR